MTPPFPPKVIFLDAAGTLFGVRGSVGAVYRQVSDRFGVEVSAEALNQSFRQSFQSSAPAAFPGLSGARLQQHEFAWWQEIAVQTFKLAGVWHLFPDFSAFFAELYRHFTTAEPWFVYPEVYSTLEQWKVQGIELGVLSNFDTRLYAVLKALDLAKFFSSVTLSTEAGAAKPDPKIFLIALQKHHCSPEQAWHIGDSYGEDLEGASAVGIHGFWLKRSDRSIPTRPPAQTSPESLQIPFPSLQAIADSCDRP